MVTLIRSFNPSVTGKTGAPLKAKNFRNAAGWTEFEELLLDALSSKKVVVLPENKNIPDSYYKFPVANKIICHGNKSDNPDADLFYMQMFYKNIFELDTAGWGVDNGQLNNFDCERNYVTLSALDKLDFLKKISETGKTKHTQTKSILPANKQLPSEFIFVPLQTKNDYVINKHSSISVVNFIEGISKSAKHTKQNVVFKIHPYSRRDTELLFAVYKAWMTNKYIFLSEENVTYLIKKSCRVVVINSGVGFESLVLGKDVTTLGEASYSICCNSVDPKSHSEYWLLPAENYPLVDFKNWFSFYISEVAFLVNDEFRCDNVKRLKGLIGKTI